MKIALPKKLAVEGGILPILALFYVVFRSIIFFSYTDVVIWPDSADYAKISTIPIWSEKFWFAHRPPAYPYLIKSFSDPGQQEPPEPALMRGKFGYKPNIAIGHGLEGDPDFANDLVKVNVTSLSIFQFLFSVISWIVFSILCTSAIRKNWLRVAGISTILLIGLDQNITIWDRHVLTESFSISLFLLIVSLTFLFVRKEHRAILFAVCFTAFVYAATKGTNAYMLVGLSFLLFIVPFLLNKQRKLWFVICGSVILALSWFNISSGDKGYRGVVPLMNVLNSRIIAEGYEDIYRGFGAAGMPEVPQSFFEQHWYAAFDTVPGLEDWLMNRGPGVYKQYLIAHPAYLFLRPFTTAESTYNRPVYRYYNSYLALYGQSNAIGSTVFFAGYSFAVFFLIGLAAPVAARRGITRSSYFEIAFFSYIFLLGILLSLVIWHGDVIEINRHMLQVAIQLRLAIVLIVFYCIDIRFFRSTAIRSDRESVTSTASAPIAGKTGDPGQVAPHSPTNSFA